MAYSVSSINSRQWGNHPPSYDTHTHTSSGVMYSKYEPRTHFFFPVIISVHVRQQRHPDMIRAVRDRPGLQEKSAEERNEIGSRVMSSENTLHPLSPFIISQSSICSSLRPQFFFYIFFLSLSRICYSHQQRLRSRSRAALPLICLYLYVEHINIFPKCHSVFAGIWAQSVSAAMLQKNTAVKIRP